MKKRILSGIVSSVFTVAMLGGTVAYAAEMHRPDRYRVFEREKKEDIKTEKNEKEAAAPPKDEKKEDIRPNNEVKENEDIHPNEEVKETETTEKYEKTENHEKADENYAAGDVNCDGKVDISDIEALEKWLFGYGDDELKSTKAADVFEDGSLNTFDLLVLRNMVSASTDDKTGSAPISILDPSLPSLGTDRVLVFAIDFPDYKFGKNNIDEKVESICFGSEDTSSSAYPMESVSAYFERSSYGRLHLQGDVFKYTAKNKIGYYSDQSGKKLAEEVMAAYEDKLDFSKYDVDSNGVLDSLAIILPEDVIEIDDDNNNVPDWWSYSVPYYGSGRYDGLKIGTFCIVTNKLSDPAGLNNKLSHELCHAMGLPDYYKYSSNSYNDTQGMSGSAGYELMDEGNGDLSAFSKIMLGWIKDSEVQVYTGGEQNFIITSMQQQPSCIIIPRKQGNGFLSEYFVIEYITGEANNAAYFSNGRANQMFRRSGGVRILHCQGEVSENSGINELKYSNYGLNYDKSDDKERVIRLVNSSGKLYTGVGARNYSVKIDSSTSGFNWYDKNGDMTVDTGLEITITGPQAGPYYNESGYSYLSSNVYDTSSFLNGSTYLVTISQ